MNARMPTMAFADELPYGPLVTEHLVLVHEPPAASRSLTRFALGALWQVTPRNLDVLPEEAISRLADDVRGVLCLLPEGAVLDVRMDMRPVTQVPAWEKARTGITSRPVAWQRAQIASGLPHTSGTGHVRLQEMTVTLGLRLPLATRLTPSMQDWLLLWQLWRLEALAAHFETRVHATLGREIDTFETLATSLASRLRLLSLAPVRLDGAGMVAAIGRALDPLADRAPLFDPGVPLRSQVALQEPTLCPQGYRVDTREAHVFSLRKAVGRTYPGMLSAPRTPAGTLHGFDLWSLAGDWPLSLVVQCTMADQQRLQERFSRQQAFAWAQRIGITGQTRAETDMQEASLRTLIQRMSSGAERVLPTGAHLIVWGPPSAYRPMDHDVVHAGVSFSLEWLQERHLGNTFFVRTLPLACNPHFPHERWLRRMRHLPAEHVAHLLPLWGSFRGTCASATALYVNRRGEDVLFDPFDGYKTPHVTVVGTSRSGKSAWFNHFLHQVLPLGASAFLLDRYGSYEALCELHGGTHIRLDLDQPFCLGPFEGPLDGAHRATLVQLLAEMCTGGERRHALRPEEMVLLGQLVQHWARNREPTAPRTMHAFAQVLENPPVPGTERLCERLSLLLSPYHGTGEYAGFIDGPNALKLSEGLWVVDISELEKAPWLQAVLVMILFDRFERFIREEARRDKPKFIGADEVSFLLRNPQAAEFLRKLSVALARFRCAFVLLSQQLSDFESDIGRVIVNNTGSFLFFGLNRREILQIKDAFELEAHYVPLIDSLRRYEDCSEALLHIPQAESGIIRVVPDRELLMHIGQEYAHRMARERQRAETAGVAREVAI